jgi:hypothetical protein
VEYNCGGGNGDDFFEYTTYAEGNDASTLKETGPNLEKHVSTSSTTLKVERNCLGGGWREALRKFARCHEKGYHPRKDQHAGPKKDTLLIYQLRKALK